MPAPEPTGGFPRQIARTRRFTVGQPRNVVVDTERDLAWFLRSRAPHDPVLGLWRIDLTGDPSSDRAVLVVDPATISDDDDLPPEERARRERARELGSGIVSFVTDAELTIAVFVLSGTIATLDLVAASSDGPVGPNVLDTPPGAFDPRLDPTGRRITYVHGPDLRLHDLVDGTDRTLLSSSDPTVTWGRADFVAAEEMGRSRGHWWSPDGTSLLVCRNDESPVATWWIADPAHPDRRPAEVRYPAAGTANPVVELHRVDLDGTTTRVDWTQDTSGATATADPPSTGAFEYLADVVWASDHPPLVVRQPRDQRSISIGRIEGDTIEEVRRITDEHWVELIPGSPSWLGDRLLTVEDRSDLDRRCLCVDGHPVDLGDLHVREIAGVDGNVVTVTAWDGPLDVHVVEVAVDGDGPARISRLTTEPGVHGVTTGTGSHVITSAAPDHPLPRTEIRHGDRSHLVDHTGERPVLDAAPRFLELGPRRLAAALFLPRDHDGSTPLPVLLDPYGGPHAQRVTRTHVPHLTSRWFAEQGYAVLVVDNRGAPGRGPAFERAVHGDLAGPVLADQIGALDAVADLEPALDLDRVGIRGWSFGGYLAALAVLRRPDRVHCAVAGAPVTQWGLYDTHYTERYLGHPDTSPESYERSDLAVPDGGLRRPLLLIHGLADDNVVAAHTLRLSTDLLAAGSPHTVLPLSGVTHMTPQEVVAENLLRLQVDFLDRHLRAGTTT